MGESHQECIDIFTRIGCKNEDVNHFSLIKDIDQFAKKWHLNIETTGFRSGIKYLDMIDKESLTAKYQPVVR